MFVLLSIVYLLLLIIEGQITNKRREKLMIVFTIKDIALEINYLNIHSILLFNISII